MSSEKYRWLLVDGFVERFNDYRASTFILSDHICIDESMSRRTSTRTINHGTVVIKSFVSPWVGSDRIVCIDAYFASVATALELKRLGLQVIGVAKTATKRFLFSIYLGWSCEIVGIM
jgi:hypothetical protein